MPNNRPWSSDIEWPDESEVSRDAIDLIDKLLQIKASERLGYQGASEVKVSLRCSLLLLLFYCYYYYYNYYYSYCYYCYYFIIISIIILNQKSGTKIEIVIRLIGNDDCTRRLASGGRGRECEPT